MKKIKIMLVDDNIDLLNMFKKGFEKLSEKYEVITVENAEKCFKLLENNQIPDLILLDIMMPEMSGWDVLAELRNKPSWEKIPVIFLTAKDDDASIGIGMLTSDGYITKPFRLEDIKETIEQYFEQRYENDKY